MIVLRVFNTHSLKWNLHVRERRDAARLEKMVKAYDLIQINEHEKVSRPTQRKISSIIYLTYMPSDIDVLDI